MIYCPVCEPELDDLGWHALMCVECRERREADDGIAPNDDAFELSVERRREYK